jgi:uncharacterized repeat protein (TIGR01451 family)
MTPGKIGGALARLALALVSAAGLWLLGTWLFSSATSSTVGALAMPFASPILAIGKTVQGTVIGGPVEYTITVSNRPGVDPATGVVVSDTLPASSYFVSAGSGGALYGRNVRWTGLTVPTGGSVQVRLTVTTCASSLLNRYYRVTTSNQGASTPMGSQVGVALVAPTLNPSFSVASPSVEVDSPITFRDTSTSNGAAIRAWSWDFGDGASGSGARVTHTYAEPGSYRVTLRITDACKYSRSVSVAAAVKVLPKPLWLPMVVRSG